MEEGQPRIMIPMSVQDDIAGQIKMIWDVIKAPLLVPLLNVGVYICLAMCLMLFVERVYMGIVIILVKLFWKKPQQRYRFEPLQDDEESGTSHYPPVLIQIPMFNEKEVLFLSLSLLCSVLFFIFFVQLRLMCVFMYIMYVLLCIGVLRFTRCQLGQRVDSHGLRTNS